VRKGLLLLIVLLALAVMIPVACCGMLWVRERQIPSNPPASFQDSDLVGEWEACCYWPEAADRLVISADGTFKQVYREGSNIVHETSWNRWWVERLPDGRVRVHLEGARYYAGEPSYAGDTGYCDPFSEPPVSVEMVGELILNVRSLSSGEIILYHMWPCGDSGAFPVVGEDPLMFRRVDTP
jgi:hypothetical protein